MTSIWYTAGQNEKKSVGVRTVDAFTINAGEDSLQLALDEVFGLPDRTSPFGGYDARGTLDIHCGAYHVHSLLWFSTGEVWQFYTDLRKAYDELAGQARFRSGEGNLDFTIQFSARGHWTLKGDYQEHLHLNSRLHFEMKSDQTYLAATLTQLAHFVAKYGDNRGYHP